MYYSVVLFTFSVLDPKHHFWANVVQKVKIVSLSWNLPLRLIWICRIQLFTFPVLDRKHLPGKIVSLSWNLILRLIRICRIQLCCSLFVFYTRNTLLVNKGKRSMNIVSEALRSRDSEIGSFRQHGFFILLGWVRLWIDFGHCLKNFK